MRIVILAAMDKELRLLNELMEGRKTCDCGGLELHRGKIGGHEVIAAKCGIGKVNAAVNALRIIREVRPDLVVNSGVAGGADAGMGIGSVLVADKVAYHDVWCGPGTEYGAADGFSVIFSPDDMVIETAKRTFGDELCYGLICSGDKFISKEEEVREIKSKFPEALACDMESAALAQVCAIENIPFNIIRVVSDTPGNGENISQYQNFWNEAPVKTFTALKTILEKL